MYITSAVFQDLRDLRNDLYAFHLRGRVALAKAVTADGSVMSREIATLKPVNAKERQAQPLARSGFAAFVQIGRLDEQVAALGLRAHKAQVLMGEVTVLTSTAANKLGDAGALLGVFGRAKIVQTINNPYFNF